ncbi:MAG: ATP-binding protein [Caulobacter sp.]|nr:ATP-binding protein [Caulobacter sp.]
MLTTVAAFGGWVWLGAEFAAAWAAGAFGMMAFNRLLFWRWIERRAPTHALATEWTVAAATFVFTVTYCALPFGLTTLADRTTAELAGVAMLAAIALSATTEFVISRRIGLASLAGMFVICMAITVWRAADEPIANRLFAILAVTGFFAGLIQYAINRVRADEQLRRALAQAEAANIAKSAFLATMSHEIRTPLNGVLGMAQAMAADELTDRQRERLMIIREAGATLTTVLNDVLDFSKIEAGKLDLVSVEFDLAGCLRTAAEPFGALAADKGLLFSVELSPETAGRFRGDPSRVRQIIGNLLSNAVKFTETGRVSLKAAWRDGAARIVVEDTGPGLPFDQIDRLFSRFSQLDASTTRRHGGTGLGLSISRDLSRLMGGDILAVSEPGQGATFSVILPVERLGEAAPARPVDAEQGAVEHNGLRVLAAEDNRVNQIVLETLLAQVGITPVIKADGAQAVQAWADGDWDLILMDVHMPVLDGVGAVREIRAREAAAGRRRTPVIALTANAMTHQVDALLACGMDLHVAKPIDAAILFRAIETALDMAEAAQAG